MLRWQSLQSLLEVLNSLKLTSNTSLEYKTKSPSYTLFKRETHTLFHQTLLISKLYSPSVLFNLQAMSQLHSNSQEYWAMVTHSHKPWQLKWWLLMQVLKFGLLNLVKLELEFLALLFHQLLKLPLRYQLLTFLSLFMVKSLFIHHTSHIFTLLSREPFLLVQALTSMLKMQYSS